MDSDKEIFIVAFKDSTVSIKWIENDGTIIKEQVVTLETESER